MTRRAFLYGAVISFGSRADQRPVGAPSVTLELEPLQGFKRLSEDPEVYADGVSVRILVAPPEASDAPLRVSDLSLELVSFKTGRVAERHYQADADRIIGAGGPKPRTFRARVSAKRDPSVHWMTGDRNDPMVQPRGKNWLDVPGTPMEALLSKEGSSTIIRGSVLADDTGNYTLRFVVGCVIGERAQSFTMRAFEVYYEN